MHRPQHHIELRTKGPLPKGAAGAWFRTVRDAGPNGITAATDMVIQRELVNTKFYAFKSRSGMHYVVPLTRDLTSAEAAAIAHAWDQRFPDGDFAINWSQSAQAHPRSDELQRDLLDQIAETAAKQYHNRWHQQMLEQGWRFGHRLSHSSKQHPMLQSWDGLSDKYRSTERDRFHTLLKVLEGLDLAITQR